MPWSDPEKRKQHRREKYARLKESGWKRDWGAVIAICPICSEVRELSKNSSNITTENPKDSEGRYIKRCRSCSKRKDYAPWFDPSFVKKKHNEKRRALKIRAIEYLGGQCLDCGLVFDGSNPYAFDFHHRDPAQKDFLPTGKTYRWEKVAPELDKCDLLCAICHRKIHYENY